MGLFVMFVTLCATLPANAAEHYEGDAYAVGDGRLLYRESHWLYEDAGVDTRIVLYHCPDGAPFARKRIRVSSNAQAPVFVLVDARNGYTEGIRGSGDARKVFVRANKAAFEHAALVSIHADTVIDAGFDAFVRSHWDTLSSGSMAPLSFIVPARLAALDFNVHRVDDEVIDGRAARRFRLALASWYGGFLPHIDVVYDLATRCLLRFEGIGNVRGTNGRNLDVRIEFSGKKLPASAADVAAASTVSLTGLCL